MAENPIDVAARAILDWYDKVATGQTRGGGGHYYADGKNTLNAITVNIELIEALATACSRTVHPRQVKPDNRVDPASLSDDELRAAIKLQGEVMGSFPDYVKDQIQKALADRSRVIAYRDDRNRLRAYIR